MKAKKLSTEQLLSKGQCYCKSKKRVIDLNDCDIIECRIWKSCCKDSWENCEK
jgi:hypothetical protein